MNTKKYTCSCGKEFCSVPEYATLQVDGNELDGYYWNCIFCNSTLFVPIEIKIAS